MKRVLNSISRKWKNYLDRLAKVNEDLYGKGRLDCCDLNRENKYERK